MPFGNIGVSGFLLIVMIALMIFGHSKLPRLGRAFGRTLGEFKSASTNKSFFPGGTDD